MFGRVILSCVALFVAAVHAESGPNIAQQPQDTIYDTASNVNSVSLHCKATGDEPITYTWTKDGATLSQESNSRLVITPGQLTITSPERTVDSGEYVCTARNEMGTVRSLPANLVFAYVEEFDPRNTIDVTLQAGEGSCITCEPPEHHPGISVNWIRTSGGLVDYRNERIRIMDDGRLCFFYAIAADAGGYKCQVHSNVQNEASLAMKLSPEVSVTVNEGGSPNTAIRIIPANRPKDVTTIAGEAIKFECFFFGPESDEIPEIQWARIDPPGAALPTGRARLEEGGEILKISQVQPDDAGTYQCYINGVRASAQLSVVEAPSWITEPLDAMKDINMMQEWNVEAEDATEYTWYRNGEVLGTRDRHQFRNNLQTLTITDLTINDTAMYQCFASNDHGIIYSAALLNVRAFAPKFLSPMEEDKPAPLSATVTVECKVDAAPAPTVTWQHNGQPITNSAHYNLTADPPNLVIVDVKNSDGGTYRCTATNPDGTASDEGSLSIKDATVITENPDSTLVEVGESTTLHCKAVHDPYLELTYVWRHNGVQIRLNDTRRYRMFGRDSGNLEIVSAELRDGGEYTCVALTVADSDESTTTLSIAGPPGPPSGLSVVIDNKAANLRWVPGTDNNSPITSYTIEGQTDHNDDEWVVLRTGESEGTTSVRIVDLEPYSLYSFRVIAVNRIGEGEPSEPVVATVRTADAAPSKSPTNLGGGGGNTGDLRITWDLFPPANWNSHNVFYNVQYQEVGSTVIVTGLVSEDDATVYVATLGIKLYTEYMVRIQAENDFGKGPYSDWVRIFSYQEAPKTAPTEVKAMKASGTSIEVSWDAIDESTFKGELMGYKLKYWSDDSNMANANTANSLGSGTSNTIINLQPNTRYTIVVAAYSGRGDGPDSDSTSETTFKSAPAQKPNGIRAVQSEKGNDLTVNWNGITTSSSEEPLKGYKVRYRTEGTFVEDAKTIVVQGTETMTVIRDLTPETTYLITVLGYSDGGNGASSDPPLSVTIAKGKTAESSDDGNRASRTAGVLSFSLFCVATLLHSLFHLL